MNQEVNKDLGAMTYAILTNEQLQQLKKIEDELNRNRNDKVYLMALVE